MKTSDLQSIVDNKSVSKARKETLNRTIQLVNETGVSEIDNMFYGKYMDTLRSKGFNPNTIGKHVTALKTLLSESGVSTKGWKSPNQETDNIFLNEVELELLYKCNLVEGTTEIVRDIFILMSFTGLRVSDYAKVNTAIVEDGMFKVRAQKVGTYSYIPKHPYVVEILKKYNNNIPVLSNATINTHIKRAALMAGLGKWKELKSHSGRRSLATNLYLKGVDAKVIMLLTGHRNTDNFYNYVKCSEKQKIEMIKKVWR